MCPRGNCSEPPDGMNDERRQDQTAALADDRSQRSEHGGAAGRAAGCRSARSLRHASSWRSRPLPFPNFARRTVPRRPHRNRAAQPQAPQPPPREQAASSGEAGNLAASGYVVARRKATVAAEITGKVVEVFIDEGMTVTEGQVVARLDSVLAEKDLRAGAVARRVGRCRHRHDHRRPARTRRGS